MKLLPNRMERNPEKGSFLLRRMVMIERRRAESAIVDYIHEELFEPGRNWPRYEFRQRCYANWAAMEILGLIQRCPQVEMIGAVERFSRKVYRFSRIDHADKDDGLIFATAYDVATDIIDILRAME